MLLIAHQDFGRVQGAGGRAPAPREHDLYARACGTKQKQREAVALQGRVDHGEALRAGIGRQLERARARHPLQGRVRVERRPRVEPFGPELAPGVLVVPELLARDHRARRLVVAERERRRVRDETRLGLAEVVAPELEDETRRAPRRRRDDDDPIRQDARRDRSELVFVVHRRRGIPEERDLVEQHRDQAPPAHRRAAARRRQTLDRHEPPVRPLEREAVGGDGRDPAPERRIRARRAQRVAKRLPRETEVGRDDQPDGDLARREPREVGRHRLPQHREDAEVRLAASRAGDEHRHRPRDRRNAGDGAEEAGADLALGFAAVE